MSGKPRTDRARDNVTKKTTSLKGDLSPMWCPRKSGEQDPDYVGGPSEIKPSLDEITANLFPINDKGIDNM